MVTCVQIEAYGPFYQNQVKSALELKMDTGSIIIMSLLTTNTDEHYKVYTYIYTRYNIVFTDIQNMVNC